METLVVIALVALVTGVVARGVSAGGPERERRLALQTVLAVDRSARDLAVATGPVAVESRSGEVRVIGGSGEVLTARPLPASWVLERERAADGDPLYRVDRLGRSVDCRLLLSGPGASVSIEVRGLLGALETDEE